MSARPSTGLEFPAMLHGFLGTVRRKVRAQGREWAREYLETGAFTQPQRMRQVPPGELLEMISSVVLDPEPRARWRIHMFIDVFMVLNEVVSAEECQRMEASFDSFCMGTPWGALYQAVDPSHPRSPESMARRFTALLRFWEVLEGPRYAHRVPDTYHTLEGLVDLLYRVTLEAWCPGGPASVREHLALAVEHMTHATREDSLRAVLRVIPHLMRMSSSLTHRDVLSDPGFLRERLAALSPEDFEDVSGAVLLAVVGPLYAWDRALGPRT